MAVDGLNTPQYVWWLRDKTAGVRTPFLYDIEDPQWSLGEFGIGTFQFKLKRSSPNWQYIDIMTRVEIRRRHAELLWGIILGIKDEVKEDGTVTQYRIIRGLTYTHILDARVIEPDDGEERYEAIGTIDDAIKNVVRNQMGADAPAGRQWSSLTVEADASAHSTSATIWGSGEHKLLQRIGAYAERYTMEFEVVGDSAGTGYEFKTYVPRRGSNKSGTVKLTLANNTLRVLSVGRDAFKLTNAIYVMGKGIGLDRLLQWQTYADSISTYGRWEDSWNAANVPDTYLAEEGQLFLAKKASPTYTVEARFNETDDCKFGTTIIVGDLLTVYDEDYGVDVVRKVIGARGKVLPGGIEDLTLILGDPARTIFDALDEAEQRSRGGGGEPNVPGDDDMPSYLQHDDVPAHGDSKKFAFAEHVHGVTSEAPSGGEGFPLGVANAEGESINAFLRADAEFKAFDNTNPEAVASAAAPGTLRLAARRDHKHKLGVKGDNATVVGPDAAGELSLLGGVTARVVEDAPNNKLTIDSNAIVQDGAPGNTWAGLIWVDTS